MAEDSEQRKDKRPIVCGTDFSATAVEAVDIAAAMAKRLETKLVLVHVDEFHGMAAVDPTLFDAALSQRRDELDREAARLRKLGIVVEEKLLSGSAFDELVAMASESKGRLLVMGAVGHGLPRRLLVGSVAERAAETSPIPTLVVRPGSKLLSWVRGEHKLKVLVGYDFSAASDAALSWLNQMQGIGQCEISIVHVDWPPEQAHRLGYHGPLPLTENPEQIQKNLERDLSERVAMLLPQDKVTVTVEPGWGRTEGYLFEMAVRQKTDLLIVGTHRRHGLSRLRLGSVSRAIMHYATTISVAVVPPAEEHERATIPKLDRVLVATDFSDLGNKAVPYGCAILRRGGTLRLIHVVEPAGAADRTKLRPGKGNPKLLAQLRSLAPADSGERFDIEGAIIESADAVEAIAQEAERFRADAICIGSHGRSGLAKTFLGSVAQGVMENSRRPVLIVRADE
jgi:nucleotide-binding universal stress UspA family protein